MDCIVFDNPGLWQLWTYCLMTADHEPFRAMFRGEEREFKAGSFFTGRLALADALRAKPSTIWGRLQKLQELEMLTLESDNKRTAVTICKWAEYQYRADGSSTAAPTSSRQPSDTTQEHRNREPYKNKETETCSAKKADVPYSGWFEKLWAEYPRRKGVRNGKAAAWDECQRLEAEGTEPAEMVRAAKYYAEACTRANEYPKDACRFFRGPNGPWREYASGESSDKQYAPGEWNPQLGIFQPEFKGVRMEPPGEEGR